MWAWQFIQHSKGDKSRKSVSPPSEREYTLKGKGCTLIEANSFLLEKIRFQNGIGVYDNKQEVTKVLSLVINGGKTTA